MASQDLVEIVSCSEVHSEDLTDTEIDTGIDTVMPTVTVNTCVSSSAQLPEPLLSPTSTTISDGAWPTPSDPDLDIMTPVDTAPQADLLNVARLLQPSSSRALKVSPIQYKTYIEELWPHVSAEAFSLAPIHAPIYTAVRNSNIPNYLGARLPVPSQINCDAWDQALVGYHDSQIALFLRYGWPGSYTAPLPPKSTTVNHPSALAYMSEVDRFLEKEVRLGAMLGPFDSPPFVEWNQTSPLMSVEKRDSDRRRIIIDLSFPEGESVNDGVLRNYFQGDPLSYKLPTINDLSSAIVAMGRGAFLWKSDLARAYRQLRSDPLDYPLMGITHRGKYFTDICPSFGCRSSSAAQQRVSEAVCHLMANQGYQVLAYIDDFCGLHPTFDSAVKAFAAFEGMCEKLGLKMAPEKSAFPATKMDWLGFTFDTLAMEVTLPPDKLAEILAISTQWLTKTRASRRDLQMLAGKLNHISQCVVPARRFMSRILSLLRRAPQTGTLPVSDGLRRDVEWFKRYTEQCNGRQLLQDHLPILPIQCDACPRGAGGFSPTQYYSLVVPEQLANDHHIYRLEALNVIVALKTLVPPTTRNVEVRVTTDNMATMHILNSGKTRDPILASCSRELWLLAALQELRIVVDHAPGDTLVLADALSRRHLSDHFENTALEYIYHLNLSPIMPVDISTVITDAL